MGRILFYSDRLLRRLGPLGLSDGIPVHTSGSALGEVDAATAAFDTASSVFRDSTHRARHAGARPAFKENTTAGSCFGIALGNNSSPDGKPTPDATFLDRFVDGGRCARGCWNVFLCTRRLLTLTVRPSDNTLGMILADRYGQIGKLDELDPPGRRRNYSRPYAIGAVREIVVLDNAMEVRALSRNSQLGAPSLNALSGQIVIFGGWMRWGKLSGADKGVKDDAMWRSAPRRVWGQVLTEVSLNFG